MGAWERDYLLRGRIWGGSTRGIPQMPVGSKVLELGCGSGKTLGSMLGKGWDLTALDISPSAVKLCSKVALGRAEVIVADVRELPFLEEKFDAIYAFHVLGHLLKADRSRAAEEARRVLKPSGELFFRSFGSDDMRAGQGIEVEPGTFCRGEGVLTHYFTEREALELFFDLEPREVSTRRWKMRVKGRDLTRSEVEGRFIKK
jgi:ubiquinone/menaquinone biosynthesis C-methylase UbiE